jgi:hypothetical protein
MKKKLLVLVILPALLLSFSAYSQDFTELPDSGYKRNVIKWNVTPFLIFSKKNINLSYERVLSPYRSFSVNAGYFELPKMSLLDTIRLDRVTKKGGYNFSADYRFYFKTRNRRMAPDGLYLSIYSSFYHTQFEMSVSAINNPDIQGQIGFGAKFNVLNAGAALGYQFVIKERLTIDLIFIGPSISMYHKKLSLEGDLTSEEYEEYLQALYDALVALVPGFDKLTQNGFLSASGINASIGFGFRYVLQIGFRF